MGLPLAACSVSTPSKRSAPGGKRFRKCFITGVASFAPRTLSTNVSPTYTQTHSSLANTVHQPTAFTCCGAR